MKNGCVGKKNCELYDIEVNPDEAEEIRGESRSGVMSAVQIISREQFERVGEGLEQRRVNYAKELDMASQEEAELSNSTASAHPPRMVPVRNCGQSLLSGNIYCVHCGARMFSSTARRTGHVGKEEKIRVYRCYSRANHMRECDGQSTYQASKVNAAKVVDEEELIRREVQTTKSQYLRQLKQAKAELKKASTEYAKWQALMLDSVAGTCVFRPEQVKGGMDEAHARMMNLRAEVSEFEQKAAEVEARSAEIRAHHRKLVNWADIYRDASLEEKRAVAAFLIKSVTLTRGYGMQVEFNISEAQYLNGLDIA